MTVLISLAHEDGHSVVIVTHNEQFAKLADRVLRIRDGTVHEEERPQADRPLARVVWSGLSCSLTRRIVRGLLTGLGIAIGVAAMVSLIGLGTELKSHVIKSVTSLGPLTSISVSPAAPGSTTGGILSATTTSGPTKPITRHTLHQFSRLSGVYGAYLDATFLTSITYHKQSTTVALKPLPPRSLWSVSDILPHLSVGADGIP